MVKIQVTHIYKIGYSDRMKFQMNQQKEWADQQVREHEERKQAEQNDDKQFIME